VIPEIQRYIVERLEIAERSADRGVHRIRDMPPLNQRGRVTLERMSHYGC
jgi:hypothetical protein